MHSKELIDSLVDIFAVRAGIAPLSVVKENGGQEVIASVNRSFTNENVAEGEARKVRRKFRKLWRKAAPHLKVKPGSKGPTDRLIAARKSAVREYIINVAVKDAIQQITRPNEEEVEKEK